MAPAVHVNRNNEKVMSVTQVVVTAKLLPVLIMCLLACADQEQASMMMERELAVIDSIGTETGPVVFGSVISACIIDNGNLVVLDAARKTVFMFSPLGECLHQRQLAGNGPGEFQNVKLVVPANTGGFWLQAGAMERKVVLFDDTLGFVREVQLQDPGYGISHMVVPVQGEQFCGVFLMPDHSDSVTQAVVMLEGDGTLERILCQNTVPHYPIIFGADFIVSAGTDGIVYVSAAVADEYLIEGYTTQGELITEMRLPDVHMQPKPPEMIQDEMEYIDSMWTRSTGNPVDFTITVPECFCMVDCMGMDGEGRLWVLRGDYLNPVFDVFDSEGSRAFTCTVRLPDWQECDRWRFHVGREGILAFPENPELYPLVYMMELQ